MAHVQQILSNAFLLLFGVLSLLVWRRFGVVRRDRAALAWGLTAANFLVVGVYANLHAVLAAVGKTRGTDSALYRLVGDWALAANLARELVSVVFGAMLVILMVSRKRWGARVVAAAPTVLTVAALISTVGFHHLPYTSNFAFASAIAISYGITAMVLMAALFAAVYHDGLDQLLWLALAVYTLKETMSVSFMAVMAAWTMTYAGTYFTVFYWVCTVLGGCMVGFAARRLQLATGGRRVPVAFEGVHAMRHPAHG
jgi:hypothetical protein